MILASHIDASAKNDGFNWEPVMDAIIQIESKGNAAAVNGPYVGVLQISPVLVKECNNILKSSGSKKRYSLSDRYSATKSKEMFVIIQSFHNPLNNIEKAIRLWSGGIRYSVSKTQAYLRKVMRQMN
ncbi:MAG: hypothetical protein ACTTI4_08330 [Prevotella fusca]|uniref:hypothetical protein n=1 Tax=Prevotella fusca TaxID=589436 RepID=UPI003F9F1BBD